MYEASILNTISRSRANPSDFSAASRPERPSCKCKVPLTSACIVVDRRCRLLSLSLLIRFHFLTISDLSNDFNFHVFRDVVVKRAILAGAGFAPRLQVVEFHYPHHAFFALAECYVGHRISFGWAVSRDFRVLAATAADCYQVVGVLVGFVCGAHRADPNSDMPSEQHVEERVDHWQVCGDHGDEGLSDGP
jgi:hypothetical protein